MANSNMVGNRTTNDDLRRDFKEVSSINISKNELEYARLRNETARFDETNTMMRDFADSAHLKPQ